MASTVNINALAKQLADPLKFAKALWPDVDFYREQREAIYSVRENDETVIPAANKVGKDFMAGAVALSEFLCHREARVITTSVKDDHLRVLWGEIGRFIQTSRIPLLEKDGGPLIVNHRDIRKLVGSKLCPISYLRGMVSEKGEGMAGHHAEYTLGIIDEASGVDNLVNSQLDTCMRRKLIFGNCNPTEPTQFFRQAVEGGDRQDASGRYYRKVIRIRAQDSPNVRFALAQQAAGIEPTGEVLVPGILTWDEYLKRRATWDEVRQTIGLDAAFYVGAGVLLFPPAWLDEAARISRLTRQQRRATAIGIDPAEGGDKTAMAAVDELGLIELVSKKTPDTSVITGEALAFMRRHGVEPERVAFDRGGGGKEHADRLRSMGYAVRTVAFGESLMMEPKRGMRLVEERLDNREERYAYKNRRAEMYGTLSTMIDPVMGSKVFAIPGDEAGPQYADLRRQLSVIPKEYDGEGRLSLPPKNKREGQSGKCLIDLIGHSPDEADAVVLAVHAMLSKVKRAVAGGVY